MGGLCTLYLCFLSVCSSLLPAAAAAAPFRSPDNFLLTCGGTAVVDLGDGRFFRPDSGAPSLSIPRVSDVVASASGPDLYRSARVFPARSRYAFRIAQPGRHLVRLHLFPLESPRYDLRSAAFSVVACGVELLRNFSFARLGPPAAVVKEYVVGVEGGELDLELSPSEGSIAFVNAIEVVSLPEGLFPSRAVPIPAGAPGEIVAGRAMETSYRLNVGGPRLDSTNDILRRV